MSDWLSLFQSDFLLRNALWGSILVGAFCPLIGVYFVLRRMVLLGVTLPQVSAAGVALAFFLPSAGLAGLLPEGHEGEHLLALAGSTGLTLLAILTFALLERRGEGTTESRLGAALAFAYACSILLVASNPTGEAEMLNLLHGEILAIESADLRLLVIVFMVLTAVLLSLHRQFIFVSFDRETATVMGMRVPIWDALLFTMIGVAISLSVVMVGPMLTFAFLIIPPLAAGRFCERMRSFFLLSSGLGAISGLLGFLLSYHMDWPLGPSDILVSFCLLLVCVLVRRVWTPRQISAPVVS